ncbi:MAG: glucose-6-phosphate dehydrogenase [Gammaproteobacteria bacterium]|nr:glucose-6-phosphate dehydrogenase [Gammaproteobacteria bacterium]
MSLVFDLVIFGGTGDLSLRKLLPSMYAAFRQKEIDPQSRIFVCCRKQSDFDTLFQQVETAIKTYIAAEAFDEAALKQFSKIIVPTKMDLVDKSQGWEEFANSLLKHSDRVRVFYLAVMPSIYGSCCKNLHECHLISATSRIVVEKPLGYDQQSAEEINQVMADYFTESQIYRIDHYLGKESVQGLLALRFGNFIFENIWDCKSIDHIQINISEIVGVEDRAAFYDEAGAMRDMVQNHLLQLLCLVAMDSPDRNEADDIRIEKIKVLKALKPITEAEIDQYVVRGQYVSGQVEGQDVKSYADELKNTKTQTETFVAVKAYLENWQWAGVPFYLRTGKRLARRSAEIVVQFKNVTHNIYSKSISHIQPNRLLIQLQPEEKIRLTLMAKNDKKDGNPLREITLNLDMSEKDRQVKPLAYQRLLLDVIKGNAALFIHRDEVSLAWKWIDPIIKAWKDNDDSLEYYKAGTMGPKKADKLFKKQGQTWFDYQA